jgi:hypothetical protein
MNTSRTLKQFLTVALGMGALVATMSATPAAKAVTWGPSVGPNAQNFWWDVDVEGHIWTNSREARLLTTTWSGNLHRGGYYVECVNQPTYAWPAWGSVWTGTGQSKLQKAYRCANSANLTVSYGWVDDNTYQ